MWREHRAVKRRRQGAADEEDAGAAQSPDTAPGEAGCVALAIRLQSTTCSRRT